MISTSELQSGNPQVEARRLRLERFLQIAAHEFDLRFEFGNRDLIGDGQIILKANALQAISAELRLLKGRALHLFGHYLSDGRPWAEAAQRQAANQPHFNVFWHALEDARLENHLIERWPGAHRLFEATLLPNLGGSLLRRMPLDEQLELGLYLEGRGYRHARYGYRVRSALEEARPFIQQAARSETAGATFEAMLSIYPIIAHLIPMGKGSARNKPAPASKREETVEETQLKDSPAMQSNDGRPEGLTEIESSDEMVSVGLMGLRQEFPEWLRPGSAPWFERDLGNKEIHPAAIRAVRQTLVPPPKGDLEVYRKLHSEVQREVGFLAHRLTNLIREQVYLRYGGYYRTGKLNMAKLWKQRTGNFRLFQRPVSGGARAVAFTLLVDESASMRGQEKYRLATKAALLLGETLDFLNIPLEIIGYTTAEYEAQAAMRLGLTPAYKYRTMRCSPLEHRLYKRFDEPYRIVRARLSGIEPRRNNWDEEHLWFAYQRLQERPEQRKVVIIISDGQPNGDANHLIQTVARLENLGVEVIGVGIGADYVQQIYPHAIVVTDFRQMAEELLILLAREFQPGPVY